MRKVSSHALMALCLTLTCNSFAEGLPGKLQGSWRIVRVMPTSNVTCWTQNRAESLIGSILAYSPTAMRWKGGSVPLLDIDTRRVSAEAFTKENGSADFGQLGIRTGSVVEVDLQHEDMDITGATTEVPGDSVLLVGTSRIVVSACGVYFEAMRVSSGTNRTRLVR